MGITPDIMKRLIEDPMYDGHEISEQRGDDFEVWMDQDSSSSSSDSSSESSSEEIWKKKLTKNQKRKSSSDISESPRKSWPINVFSDSDDY